MIKPCKTEAKAIPDGHRHYSREETMLIPTHAGKKLAYSQS